jgi:hypothetical protein
MAPSSRRDVARPKHNVDGRVDTKTVFLDLVSRQIRRGYDVGFLGTPVRLFYNFCLYERVPSDHMLRSPAAEKHRTDQDQRLHQGKAREQRTRFLVEASRSDSQGSSLAPARRCSRTFAQASRQFQLIDEQREFFRRIRC